MDGVLFARFGFGEVFVAAEEIGDAEIGLQDAAEHLLVESFLERLGGRENGVGVGVFLFEVGDDAGVVFFAEPGVVVHAAVAVKDVFDGGAEGDGRAERVGGGFG